MMLYVNFIRRDGCKVERGYIAGKPSKDFPQTSTPFIVCKIDPSILQEGDLSDDSIRLNFAKLQKPNTIKQVTDEEGTINTVTVYDYFDPNGRSSEEEAPLIDFTDVIRGGDNG